MSALASTHADKGLVVLAVNAWDESKDTVQNFVRDKQLKQRMLLQGGEIFNGPYGLNAVPTLFWIDRNGTIVDASQGDDPSALRSKTEALLAKG